MIGDIEDDVAKYRIDGNRVTNDNKCRVICRGGSNKDVPWRTTSYDDPLTTNELFLVSPSDTYPVHHPATQSFKEAQRTTNENGEDWDAKW